MALEPGRLGDLREWLIDVGRREAIDRVSHRFCEIHARQRSVGQVTRLRRLMEYRIQKERSHLVHECKDHLHLLDLIEAGNREAAACFLEEHLAKVKTVKLDLVAS